MKNIIKLIITTMTPANTLLMINICTLCPKPSTPYVNVSFVQLFTGIRLFLSLRNFQKKKVGSIKTVKSGLSNKYFWFGVAIQDLKL